LFRVSLRLLSETSFILRRTERDVIIYIYIYIYIYIHHFLAQAITPRALRAPSFLE
jgi:hypothetical protein